MTKKAEILLYWILLAVFLFTTFGFTSKKEQEIVCHDINVFFSDGNESGFISKDEVIALFDKKGIKILGYPLKKLPLAHIEELVISYPQVEKAEAYYDMRGVLHVEIIQRIPVMRVTPRNGEGYYIAEEGVIMPLSQTYAAHVIYVNGYIDYVFKGDQVICLFDEEKNQKNKNILQIAEIFELARYLHNDSFWKSQFVQIYVNRKKEIELIPRVGAHIIKLGEIENYDQKLQNLKAVYEKGFNNIGWNQYEKIDLRYASQVICTRR